MGTVHQMGSGKGKVSMDSQMPMPIATMIAKDDPSPTRRSCHAKKDGSTSGYAVDRKTTFKVRSPRRLLELK